VLTESEERAISWGTGDPEFKFRARPVILGNSSITVTLDTYRHLFARDDDGVALAESARYL